MTRNILIRAGKSPFDTTSAEETLATNLMGNNIGNLLFSTAAFKLVSTPGTSVTANGLRARPDQADAINERYDCFVLPLANAFRPSFEPHLQAFTELIEQLRIPVVVVSCGAQSTLSNSFEPLRKMDDLVTRFMRAVLDRSASVAVRGEFTAAYLKSLGFNDVRVVGCPSMFMFGDSLRIRRGSRSLSRRTRLALNFSNSAADVERFTPLISSHLRKGSDLVYVAQGKVDLELLIWGESVVGGTSSSLPVGTTHPLYRENRIRLCLDPWTWMRFLRERDFSLGTRIHGNIAAVLAGTPAHVLAHDSRTLELARYFEIPHTPVSSLGPGWSVEDIYAKNDYSSLEKNHGERFSRYTDFLRENDLDNIFSHESAAEAFDRTMDRTSYPPPVESSVAATPQQLIERMQWLRNQHRQQIAKVNSRLKALEVRLQQIDAMAR